MNNLNIKTRPLLIAAGVGTVVLIVYSLIVNGISLAPILSGNYDPLNPSPVALVLALLACICIPIVDGGAGFLYTYLHSREAPVTVGDGAIGGAASGVIIHIIGGLFGACVGAVVTPLVLQQTAANIPPDVAGAAMAGGIAGGLVGAVIGLCVGIVIGAALGAIGGAVGGAVLNRGGRTALA